LQPVPLAAKQLAERLRQLRQQQWPDARLTQNQLASAFSSDGKLAAVTVSSWESVTSPKVPPRHRLQAYARFFATHRSIEGGVKLLSLGALTPDELAAYKELEAELLRLAARGSTEAAPRSWHFSDGGPITLICAELPGNQKGPLAKPADPNYTALQAYADIDALVELHGHVRAENPNAQVHFRIVSQVDPDDLTGHLILIGGVVWNEITERLSVLARLPIRQFEHPELGSGEIFAAIVTGDDGEQKEEEFWPKWTNSERAVLTEDVGLLARVPNPLNSNRTLTICNGIHSRGVYGAVRSLTDAQLRAANERYIATAFGNSRSFAILMSVDVIKDKGMTPDFNRDGVVLYQWSQGVVS